LIGAFLSKRSDDTGKQVSTQTSACLGNIRQSISAELSSSSGHIRNNSADSSRWLVSTSGLICFRSGERNITNSDLDEPAAEYLKANIGHGSSGHIRSMLQKWGPVQIGTMPELCES